MIFVFFFYSIFNQTCYMLSIMITFSFLHEAFPLSLFISVKKTQSSRGATWLKKLFSAEYPIRKVFLIKKIHFWSNWILFKRCYRWKRCCLFFGCFINELCESHVSHWETLHVMADQSDIHFVINIAPFRMMVHLLCTKGYSRHEPEGLVEVLQCDEFLNSVPFLNWKWIKLNIS